MPVRSLVTRHTGTFWVMDLGGPVPPRPGPRGQAEFCRAGPRQAEALANLTGDDPQAVRRGMFLKKGVPKSLFRPGSSAVVLLFENGRAQFAPDLMVNVVRSDAQSRFSRGFEQPLVETDIQVRSLLACRTNV